MLAPCQQRIAQVFVGWAGSTLDYHEKPTRRHTQMVRLHIERQYALLGASYPLAAHYYRRGQEGVRRWTTGGRVGQY